MIEKEMRGDIRQGDREKALLNALRKIKGERVRLNSGTTPVSYTHLTLPTTVRV